MSIGVIWNRNSRRGRHLNVGALFPNAEIADTREPGDGERLAADMARRHDTVVAVGGDGTIHAVVNGLSGADVALGILPCGTGNVLAAELGIPVNEPRRAAEIATGAHERRVDLGEAGGRRFVASAGYGLDAKVVPVADGLKPVFGRASYIIVALGMQFTTAPWQVQVSVDGEPAYDGPMVLTAVATATRYGGFMTLSHQADIADGLMELAILTPGRWLPCGTFGVAIRSMLSAAESCRRVRVFRGSEFSFSFANVPPAQIDGELWPGAGFAMRTLPRALRVKAPD